jgi:hypothetical protein
MFAQLEGHFRVLIVHGQFPLFCVRMWPECGLTAREPSPEQAKHFSTDASTGQDPLGEERRLGQMGLNRCESWRSGSEQPPPEHLFPLLPDAVISA